MRFAVTFMPMGSKKKRVTIRVEGETEDEAIKAANAQAKLSLLETWVVWAHPI